MAELLKMLFAIDSAGVFLTYTEFLKVLGLVDDKNAREAYDALKVLLQKIQASKHKNL